MRPGRSARSQGPCVPGRHGDRDPNSHRQRTVVIGSPQVGTRRLQQWVDQPPGRTRGLDKARHWPVYHLPLYEQTPVTRTDKGEHRAPATRAGTAVYPPPVTPVKARVRGMGDRIN